MGLEVNREAKGTEANKPGEHKREPALPCSLTLVAKLHRWGVRPRFQMKLSGLRGAQTLGFLTSVLHQGVHSRAV